MSESAFSPNSKLVSYAEPKVQLADDMQSAMSTLSGVSDALLYRASADDDDMLAMLANVVNEQVRLLEGTLEHAFG